MTVEGEVEHPLRQGAHGRQSCVPPGQVVSVIGTLALPVRQSLTGLGQMHAQVTSQRACESAQLSRQLEVAKPLAQGIVGLSHQVGTDIAKEVHMAAEHPDRELALGHERGGCLTDCASQVAHDGAR